ncbi:hypothetical protein Acr_00g0075950 [Actinidia rufa]|uniref:Retrotransposon gag domain-containing protein n=1 Tax=Actinidia rufa TaxID=165716 RepID=A0A7J0DUL4_9ERIC|nr:hypothetical protein Acr_00g0075950 [Actinidia rufa]
MERVLRAKVSSKFKLPTQLRIYEGKKDPMDHLDSYKSLMLLQDCSDEVMRKAFFANLKGSARSWFRKLPPGTIDSFNDLSRLFIANFMCCRIIEDPSDKVVIMAMMEGFRPDPLFDSLSKNVPETLSALQSKANKYIAVEELAEAKRRRPRTLPRRPELILPPLNAPIAQKQIANLIKKGYLRKYVIDRPPPNSPERRYSDNRPTARDIQVIHGVYGSGGCSNSSSKRHARNANGRVDAVVYNLSSLAVDTLPPIIFNNDDLRGLHLPHDDALVVSAVIINFNVQRILVDNGSSADLIHLNSPEGS